MFGFIPFSGSLKEDFCMLIPLGSMLNKSLRWRPSWTMDRLQSNNTWSTPHKGHSYYVWFHSIQWLSKRSHLYAFPIGSYV